MRHEKEWYTCDRCGNNFDKAPKDVLGKIISRMWAGNLSELTMITAEHNGYVSDENLVAENVVSAQIIEYYDDKRKEIHLCGKCRKDFERFMRNEL